MLLPPRVNRNQIVKRAAIALIAVSSLFVIVMTAPDPFGPMCPPLGRLLPPESDWVFWTDRVEEIPAQSAVLRHELEPISRGEKASSRQADMLLHVLGILSSFRDQPLISGEMGLAGALAREPAPDVAAPLRGVDRRSSSRIAWLLALWRPSGAALRRALRVVSSREIFDRHLRDLLPSNWGVTVDDGIIEIADPEALWTSSPPVTGIRPPDDLFITVVRDLIVVSTDRRRILEVIDKVNGDAPTGDSAPSIPDAPIGGAALRLAPRARGVLHEELSFLGVGPALTLVGRLFEEPESPSPLEIRWHWHAVPPKLTIAFQGRKGLHPVPRERPKAELTATLGVSTAAFDSAVTSTFGPDGRAMLTWKDRMGSVVALTGAWREGSPRWTAEGRGSATHASRQGPVEVMAVHWRRPVGRALGESSALISVLPATLHAHGRLGVDGRLTILISIEPPAMP